MNTTLSTMPQPFFQLVKQVFVAYVSIYPAIIWLLLAYALVHIADTPIHSLYWPLALILFIVLFLLGVLIYAAMLIQAQNKLTQQRVLSLKEVMVRVKPRIWPLFGVVGLVFLVNAVIGFSLYGLSLLAIIHEAYKIFMLVSVALIVTVGVYLFFSMPLVILDNLGPVQGIKHSLLLVHRHWWRAFGVLLICGLITIGLASVGFIFYHQANLWLLSAYDFVLYMLVYPFFIAATLIVLNDLKLSSKMSGQLSRET